MPEPVLIIHGVANHESGPFLKSVEQLQKKINPKWQLVPIFWGDLGGAAVDIGDCLPIFHDRVWTARGDGFEGILSTSIWGNLGRGRLTNGQRAAILLPDEGEFQVRSGGPDLQAELEKALDQTHTLQHIDDEEVLASLREVIGATKELAQAVSESDINAEFDVRGAPEPFDRRGRTTVAIERIVKSVDVMLGKMLGNNLGALNQRLRNVVAEPFSKFFGDILVYQANKDKILDRVWKVLGEEAPSFGTSNQPINAIAHSLGGLVIFDALLREHQDPKRLHLKGLVTFGSQPAFFHIVDPRVPALLPYKHGQKVRLPETVAKWTNLWDTLDVLAFTAGTVFQLFDGSSPSDIPVEDPLSLILDEKGWTHSIYWQTEQLIEAIRIGLM